MAFFTRRYETDDSPQAHSGSGNGDIEIEEIRDVLRRASLGDLDARVSHVTPDSPFAGIADDVNRLLDLVDSYLRESQATLTAAAEGRSYRRFITRGMLGAFTTNAQRINAVVDTFNALREGNPIVDGEASDSADSGEGQAPATPTAEHDDGDSAAPIPHTAW